MKTLLTLAAGAALIVPGAAAAQSPAPSVAIHALVPGTGPQSSAERQAQRQREQERLREQQERLREQQERLREQQAQQRERDRERQREHQRAAQSRQHAAEQVERLSRTMKLGPRGEIVVSNLSGDIIVTRGGNDVQIEAVKTARARTEEEAREMLSLVQVEFADRSGRGEARVQYPHERDGDRDRGPARRNVNVSVVFNVTAPEQTRVTVRTLSGDVKVTDIKGEVSLTSTSGDVEVLNGARVLSAKSTSGNVRITNTTSESSLEANSVSGDVLMRQVRAPRLQLGTISGKVLMHDVESNRIEAQSLSGDVELAGSLAKSGRYDLSSHAGNVRLVLAGNVGFELDANTFSGNVRSDVALKGDADSADDRGRRAGRNRSLKGIFGDGSALVDITTFSGNVVVTRR